MSVKTGFVRFLVPHFDLRKILILPDREIDLGTFANNETITLDRRVSGTAIEFVARKVSREEALVVTRQASEKRAPV